MENQNGDGTVVGGGAADNLENGNSTTHQEVSSTTPVLVINKRSLRVKTWKNIQDNKAGIAYNTTYNRIPRFIDADKAAENMLATEEFTQAQNIKVNIDRALHAAKLQTLLAGKNLYLPATRESSALFLKVNVPEDATEEQKKDLLHVQDVETHRIEISMDNKVELDIVVIGSVVVSRDGYRIGRGNGFTDLDIGFLIEVGAITPKTLIVTMVHDLQVVDTLPTHLFESFDTPVDIIITPTEVIRVANRLPRPAGVYWELLSERRIKLVPALAAYRDKLVADGKTVSIKDEDTDIEQFTRENKNRRRGNMNRGRFGRRNPRRRATSQTDTEQQLAENNTQPQRRFNRDKPRRYMNRRRRTTKSEGDNSGVEGGAKSQERKGVDGSQNNHVKRNRNNSNRNNNTNNQNHNNNESGRGRANSHIRRQKQRRLQRDFSVKLTNITREVRVKDLKTELRRRECTPLFISWKGQYGKCYLHFGNRDGTPSTEDDMDKVLQSLADLSLTVSVPDKTATSVTNEAEAITEDVVANAITEEVVADAITEDVVADAKPDEVKQTEDGVAVEVTTNEEKPAEDVTAAATRTVIVPIAVELIKYDKDTAGNQKNYKQDNNKTYNGGVKEITADLSAAGDASANGARIESVDTTTV